MKKQSRISQVAADTRWLISRNKVDKAVATLDNYGVGFNLADATNGTPMDGIVGLPGNLSKRETRKISAAANTMTRNSAGFFKKESGRKTFTPNTAIIPGNYAPLKFADHTNLQDRSYQQSNNSVHLRAPLRFIQRTNFDPRLQSHPNRRVLSIEPEEAQEWAATTESIWRSEKESKEWDESLKNNYAQLADIALNDYLGKGEFFAVRRAYYDDADRITNISIQLFSPFQIQSPVFTGFFTIQNSFCDANQTTLINAASFLSELPKGNYIEGGIEYNRRNQEIAIFICPIKLGDPWIRVPFKTRSGFVQVLHGFIQREPGQNRGIADGAYSWHEYMNIRDLHIFELNSARLNSTIAGTVTADSNAQPAGRTPMTDLGEKPGGWPDTPPTEDVGPYSPPDYDVREVNGGGFIVQNFTPGYKYDELSTSRPNLNIPKFVESLLEYIYPADHGISIEVVKQRFGGSYNASKGAIDLSWKNGIEYFLKQFSSDYHHPNYTAWLAGKVSTGEIVSSGWETPRLRNAWSAMTIITPPKPSLNPLAEAKAGKERLGYFATNGELEAQQQTGTSFEENVERGKQENEKRAESLKPIHDLENPVKEVPGQNPDNNTEEK